MLSSTTRKVVYNIAGVQTPISTGYEIPFRIFEDTDINVTISLDTGEETPITTGWTVQEPSSDTGVYKVVFSQEYTFPTGSQKLIIARSVPAEQNVDLRNGDAVDAEVLEEMFDRLTAIAQQLSEETNRALKFPISETPEGIVLPEASKRQRKSLGFDSDGTTLIMFDNPDDAIAQAEAANEQSAQILQNVTTLKGQTDDAKEAAEEAQGKAEDAQAAAEQAKSDTQDIADEAEATIGNSNTTGLRGDAVTAIQAAKADALAAIGESDSAGARGNAIDAISAALAAALTAIGQTDSAGARGAAITAIAETLADALAAIGQSNDAGARGNAISAISQALTNALASIGQSDTAGARGDAISAIAEALQEALLSIGTSDTAGARGDAITAISQALSTALTSWSQQVSADNTAFDNKVAQANTVIDEKVQDASDSASAANDAKEAAEAAQQAAEDARDEAQAIVDIGPATETKLGLVKISDNARGTGTDTGVSQAGMKAELETIDSSLEQHSESISSLDTDIAEAKQDITNLEDAVGTLQDDMTAVEESIENIGTSIMLPIPELDYRVYAANDGGLLKIANTWTGYTGVSVRAKNGSEPSSATDGSAVPADGLAISSNGTWYIRAFSPTNQASPSAILLVSGLKCQKPKFSYNTDLHQVTLSAVTAGSQIRYTTDDSEPTSSSTLYSGPFTVSVTCTIKAKAFKSGLIDSDITEGVAQVAKVWGVVWDRNNSSTKLTRLTPENDPKGIVTETVSSEPVAAKNASDTGSSPFDSEEKLWGELKMRNIVDGVPGAWEDDDSFSLSQPQVMVKMPNKAYYDITKDTAGKKTYYYIADGFAEGLALHPGSGDGKYLARYFQNSSYNSVTGGSAQTTTLTTHRTQATAKGDGFYLGDVAMRALVDLLYIIEYADWNSQQVIGNGNTDAQSANGGTDSMVYHTGINGSTCQYRHLENLWGYYEWVDGILFQNGKIYICTDHTKYASTITEDYQQYGFTYSSTIGQDYITDFAQDDNNAWLMFIPSSCSGGSSSTYVPDYGYLYYSSSVFGLYVGLSSSSSGNGLFCFRSNNTPDGNYSAARLAFEEPSAA